VFRGTSSIRAGQTAGFDPEQRAGWTRKRTLAEGVRHPLPRRSLAAELHYFEPLQPGICITISYGYCYFSRAYLR
jgi:hypothetical protein